MITVKEAKEIVHNHSHLLGEIPCGMADADGYALALDCLSPMDIPSFRQSSMDGYAIKFGDRDKELLIQDTLPAGTSRQISLAEGLTVKVFTGGPVPDGADTVVQKEMVSVDGQSIRIAGDFVKGANIRLTGSEIHKGQLAIPAKTVLNPMMLGYLAGMGFDNVPVYRKPHVAIVISGDELVQPGSALVTGQVYDANSFSLKACLKKAGIHEVSIYFTRDDLAATEKTIGEALSAADMVLVTGGVSVGDYDFVARACHNLGITTLFHGVKQKPGKPLFFGKKGEKLVWGLPGNPSSVLSCFQQYVLPAIHQMAGTKMPSLCKARLAEGFEKKAGLCFFLKGYYENGVVSILSAQESFRLSAFVMANCWVELSEEETVFAKDTEVAIHIIN